MMDFAKSLGFWHRTSSILRNQGQCTDTFGTKREETIRNSRYAGKLKFHFNGDACNLIGRPNQGHQKKMEFSHCKSPR